jgi:hypothetical protein
MSVLWRTLGDNFRTFLDKLKGNKRPGRSSGEIAAKKETNINFCIIPASIVLASRTAKMPESFNIIAENTGIAIFRIGLLAATLLAHSAVWTQQVTTRPVTIQVTDQSGAPIPHAQVRLNQGSYSDPTSEPTNTVIFLST